MGETIIGDWRLTCAVATLVTLSATIVSGVQNQVANPDLLSRFSECVGRLRVLMMELESDDADTAQINKQYKTLLIDFAELDL